MLGKMGIGLAALLGKELFARGAAGGALGILGGLGKRMAGSVGGKGGASPRGQGGGQGRGQGGGGRARQAAPSSNVLEDALRRLLDDGRAAASGAAGMGQAPRTDIGGTIPGMQALPSDTPADTAAEQRRAAALDALLAHITSFADGRVRLRHPVLREAAVHVPLREELTRAGCFTGLTFNAKTGSLLLEYDPRRHSRADFLDAALPVGLLLARCA